MIMAPFPARIGGGGALTYKGPPETVVYWSLVGLDVMGEEVGAYGHLKWAFTRTDKAGYAINYYFAPTNPSLAGLKDRVKVTYGTG
jgi:hypothetical protein